MKYLFSTLALCVLIFASAGSEILWKSGSGLEHGKALYRLKCIPAKERLRLSSISDTNQRSGVIIYNWNRKT